MKRELVVENGINWERQLFTLARHDHGESQVKQRRTGKQRSPDIKTIK